MTTRQWAKRLVELLSVWGVLAAIVAVGFVATYQYVGAPPPKTLRIASGGETGAYYAFAQRYARQLADDGITLEVVVTAGSVENLARLRRGDVDLALAQGGSASEDDREQLQALGSLFLEPLWIFTRDGVTATRLADLSGLRLAVGEAGSGTGRLAGDLLGASGLTAANTRFVEGPDSAAGALLARTEVDAAFVVGSASAPVVQDLLRQPGLALFDFERAAAYSRVFPFLTPVPLSEGVLDLARNVPPRDLTAVAVAAMLAARRDLHASLIPAVLQAVTRVHQTGGILEEPRQFPSVDYTDLPLNEDAARYLTDGASFLYRWLPYGTAVQLDRLKLLMLPLVALLLPLFRIAPPLYQWRIRSRIYRWYDAVRDVDLEVQEEDATEERLAAAADRLRALEREVTSVTVPLAYTGELYHLRLHLRLLEDKVEARRQRLSAP